MVNRGRLGNSIRGLRATAGGMTQAELGAMVGVTRQTIIAIEQGKYSPSLETAFLIAGALKHPLTEVFTYEYATPVGAGN
ncbi:helix-turn-helix transcriptional regulator [Paeniglutamicibacter psychrophenolicus]|nr:helix-turn-helix transcriptional regulator [Paeniglutamicibacter psychrophenolicus]